MAKSQKNTGPGYEGRFEQGERTIDDPFEPGRRYKAAVNVRESAIDHMASRGRINRAQAEAGERFRKLFEQAAIGQSRAIDPGKENVEGGKLGDPLSDALMTATKELKDAMQATGLIGSRILRLIVETGSVEKAAKEWARAGGVVTGRRAEGYITGTLVDALDALVRHWQLESKSRLKMHEAVYLRFDQQNPEHSRPVPVQDDIVSERGLSVTGPSFEIHVGRFGDVERQAIKPREHVARPQSTGSVSRRS